MQWVGWIALALCLAWLVYVVCWCLRALTVWSLRLVVRCVRRLLMLPWRVVRRLRAG